MAQTELCIPPQTCTARRDPRRSYTATIGTMFHIQYRGIQIKVNKVPHTTVQELKALIGKAFHNQYRSIQIKVKKVAHTTTQELKAFIGKAFHNQYRSIQTKVNPAAHSHNPSAQQKSPRGVQRGRGFTAPLRFSSFPKPKNKHPAKEENQDNQIYKKTEKK